MPRPVFHLLLALLLTLPHASGWAQTKPAPIHCAIGRISPPCDVADVLSQSRGSAKLASPKNPVFCSSFSTFDAELYEFDGLTQDGLSRQWAECEQCCANEVVNGNAQDAERTRD